MNVEPLAVLFFITFTLGSSVVLLNLVIASLLEKFFADIDDDDARADGDGKIARDSEQEEPQIKRVGKAIVRTAPSPSRGSVSSAAPKSGGDHDNALAPGSAAAGQQSHSGAAAPLPGGGSQQVAQRRRRVTSFIRIIRHLLYIIYRRSGVPLRDESESPSPVGGARPRHLDAARRESCSQARAPVVTVTPNVAATTSDPDAHTLPSPDELLELVRALHAQHGALERRFGGLEQAHAAMRSALEAGQAATNVKVCESAPTLPRSLPPPGECGGSFPLRMARFAQARALWGSASLGALCPPSSLSRSLSLSLSHFRSFGAPLHLSHPSHHPHAPARRVGPIVRQWCFECPPLRPPPLQTNKQTNKGGRSSAPA